MNRHTMVKSIYWFEIRMAATTIRQNNITTSEREPPHKQATGKLSSSVLVLLVIPSTVSDFTVGEGAP